MPASTVCSSRHLPQAIFSRTDLVGTSRYHGTIPVCSGNPRDGLANGPCTQSCEICSESSAASAPAVNGGKYDNRRAGYQAGPDTRLGIDFVACIPTHSRRTKLQCMGSYNLLRFWSCRVSFPGIDRAHVQTITLDSGWAAVCYRHNSRHTAIIWHGQGPTSSRFGVAPKISFSGDSHPNISHVRNFQIEIRWHTCQSKWSMAVGAV